MPATGRPAHLSLPRRYIKPVLVGLALLFCLVNVYRSVVLSSDQFTSSHDYFRRESRLHQLTISPHRDYITRAPAEDTNKSRESALTDLFERIRHVTDEDYPPYHVTDSSGVSRQVPLWQRRLAGRQRNRSALFELAEEDDGLGPYFFLTALLQVR